MSDEKIKCLPWVEKYRPQTISEISSQEHIINSIKKSLVNGNLPHLLFYGPSGCGKTTTILAIARDLFGKELWDERVLEFNASDERGINVIRDKIKVFAKNSINQTEKNKDKPNWKIIILDEADSMTTDSQFALRRIMETYSKITRFCIICNYINKIIDPIASRCAKYRFKSLPIDSMVNRLQYICKEEKINCNKNVFKKIIEISRGDMRKAVNFLQRSYNAYGADLDLKIVNEVSGHVPDDIFVEFFELLSNRNYEEVSKFAKYLINSGYSSVNIVVKLYNKILDLNLSDSAKSNIILKLMEVDYNLINGCDEFIQLLNSFVTLMKYVPEGALIGGID
ncbi:DNA polymerase III, delta subunit [seawater metagenome]|uniref:DNA polymerase III, delta subunit n=1 Tax=seawater metagenome TaxID=1561972 RepID=A0A5E8CM90_9ZZZZ